MSQTVDHVRGSVAVVTGATSGIGLGLAHRLASSGVKVVVSSRSQEKIDRTIKEIEAATEGAIVKGKTADAYKWDDVVALMEFAQSTFGHIDYVYVNGGDLKMEAPVFDKLEQPNISEITNSLNGVYFTIHAATPFLAKSPAKDRAVIITGSEAAYNGFDLVANYTVAKSALSGLVFAYEDLLKPHGIRINMVSMAYVLTGITAFQNGLGGFREADFIPIEVICDAYMHLTEDTTKTGVITRIPHGRAIPFDVTAEKVLTVKLSYWAPFLAKAAAAGQGEAAPQ